jgi:hypothetical protein
MTGVSRHSQKRQLLNGDAEIGRPFSDRDDKQQEKRESQRRWKLLAATSGRVNTPLA